MNQVSQILEEKGHDVLQIMSSPLIVGTPQTSIDEMHGTDNGQADPTPM